MDPALLDNYTKLQKAANYAKASGRLLPYEPLEDYVSTALFDPQFRNTSSMSRRFWWARAKHWKDRNLQDKTRQSAEGVYTIQRIDSHERFEHARRSIRDLLSRKLQENSWLKKHKKTYLTIFDLLVQGYEQKEIAKELGVCQQAISTKIRNIRKQLACLLDI